jgi:ABC-2 type transport system ATP-binding protein
MADVAIATNNLSKKYGSKFALNNLNLSIKRGEIFGYLGPNGAGKTTTIRLLLGLIKPSDGSSKIFGLDSQAQKLAAHKDLAYIPGETSFWPNLTGAETLELLSKVHGSVDKDYMNKLITDFSFEPNKKIRAYSKGNRQKIAIIAALSTRAPLLIMDEPTSGLDPLMEQVFKEHVLQAKKNGQTVFLSSHILAEVEALCDKLGILKNGQLVELGSLKEMRHLSSVTIEATFEGTPPDLSAVANVSAVEVVGKSLTAQVKGDISEVLSLIAKAKPKTLISREPSLEELFLSEYSES